VRLYAASSSRAPFTEVAGRFTAQHSTPVRLEFGASGLLRQRRERGEPTDVFASADMDHHLALAK
jgi:molybdate transport system substrate-binding protein